MSGNCQRCGYPSRAPLVQVKTAAGKLLVGPFCELLISKFALLGARNRLNCK